MPPGSPSGRSPGRPPRIIGATGPARRRSRSCRRPGRAPAVRARSWWIEHVAGGDEGEALRRPAERSTRRRRAEADGGGGLRVVRRPRSAASERGPRPRSPAALSAARRRTLEQDGVPDGDPARVPHLGVDAEAVLRGPGDLEDRVPHPDSAADPGPSSRPVEGEHEVRPRVVGGAALGHLAQRGPVDRLPGDEVDRCRRPADRRPGSRRTVRPSARSGGRSTHRGPHSPGRWPAPARPWPAAGRRRPRRSDPVARPARSGPIPAAGTGAPASEFTGYTQIARRGRPALPRSCQRTLRGAAALQPPELAVQVGAGPALAAPIARSRRPGRPSARASRPRRVPSPAARHSSSHSTGLRWPRSELHRRQAATSFSSHDGPPLTRGTTCSVVGAHERGERPAAPDAGVAVPGDDGAQPGRAVGLGGHTPIVPAATRTCPSTTEPQASRSGETWGSRPGGRYWVRTSDLFGVNEALYH